MDVETLPFGEQVDGLIRIIALTLDEAISGSMLASDACLSRFHFQRLFRRKLGETPGAFRRRLLLERAACLLSATKQDVTGIAFDADYESLEGFSRTFRRAYGVSPSHYRRLAPHRHWLPAPSGIHFDPTTRSPRPMRQGVERMDLTTRLIEHDVWLTRRLLERASTLTDAQLDMPLHDPQRPLPFESADSTLRRILERLVATKEMWVAAVRGRALSAQADESIMGLRRRLEIAFAEFSTLVHEVHKEEKWDETFVDAICAPPETFTYGGMIAHVVTYSAFRRQLALKELEALGITDLGFGDPIEWEQRQGRE